MTPFAPRKVFPGASICPTINFGWYPFSSDLNDHLEQMQMYPLCATIERRYGTSGGVPPQFCDCIVYFYCGEFPCTKLCKCLESYQRGQELRHTNLNPANCEIPKEFYLAPLVLGHLTKQAAALFIIRAVPCEPYDPGHPPCRRGIT